MKSFFYSSYRKNAVIAGAIFSQIVLVLLAFYAGFIDQRRKFCASDEQDSESVLVQYTRAFAIFNTIDFVFCWSLVFSGVHKSSPTNTEEECEIHDKNLIENENIQYLIISSMVEMLALGIYGIVCLVIVPKKCSDGPVSDGFCHTITWVLTVCSIAWAISVGFYVHGETYVTRLQRANERYKTLHDGVLATFMLAEDRRLAQKEVRFCTLPSSRAVTAFTGLDGDLLHDVMQQMHASKLSDTELLANLHCTTCFLAEQSAKLYSNKYIFSTSIIRDAIRLQCAPSIIELVILCNPSALHMVESRDFRQTRINDGGMPLHFAVAYMESDSPYNLEVLRVLLKWNPAASFFTGDDQIHQLDMMPALHNALKSKNTGEIVELLVSQHPLVVNRARMNGRTQLHIELGFSNITLGQMQSMVRHASRDTLLAMHMQTQDTPLQMACSDIYNHINIYGLVILRQLIAACPDALCRPSIALETVLLQVCHQSYQQEGIEIDMHVQMLELIRLMATAYPPVLFITDQEERRPLELMLPRAQFSLQHQNFCAQVESTLHECERVASREGSNA